jgi:hypothetical protein
VLKYANHTTGGPILQPTSITRSRATRVVASSEAAEFIRQRGGRLYVRMHRHRRCGGGLTLLDASTSEPDSGRFLRSEADGFTTFLDLSGHPPPDEIHVTLRGWIRRRIEAYWNGCAWVEDEP